ncbi:MAG TPA: hypothetical protein VG247_07950 [Pseudonocardiaceae bacterium]|nr:hypothetical protein [Pseudonocardiaceae bacterium]
MNDAPRAKPAVWFPDTSALITLAVHEPLHAAVRAVLSRQRRVLVTAIVDELDSLSRARGSLADWARTALGQLDWLGRPVEVDVPVGTRLAASFQERLAGERPLRHCLEHYGEAAIVALACRARKFAPRLLSDDYGARALAKVNGIEPVSVHRLLFSMISAGHLVDAEAADFAAVLHKTGRAADYTIEELRSGRLGRSVNPDRQRGKSRSLPVVRRLSRSSCALAASASG